MKSQTFFILILLASLFNFDNGITQTTIKLEYTTILESEDFKELNGILLFNQDESFFYILNSEFEQYTKENSNKHQLSNDTQDFNMGFSFNPPKDSLLYQVYIDRDLSLIKSRKTIFKSGTYYPCVIHESTNLFEWELSDDRRQIDSFTAYKATTKFRGRNYTAWYTPAIKLDAGPWKFHGLPGLILEVVDDEMGVQFLFSSLQTAYEFESKIQPPIEELNLTIEEYADFNTAEKITQEFINMINANLPSGAIVLTQSSFSTEYKIKGIEREFN